VQGADDLAEPVSCGFSQRRRADDIRQPLLVEDRYRPVGLGPIEIW